jgi:exodeoxyribonuclease VII small subunit
MPVSRKPKATEPTETLNYEATVEKVEEILGLMESGNMSLNDVFEQFGVAASYLKECDRFLGERRSQVDLLIEQLTDDPDF